MERFPKIVLLPAIAAVCIAACLAVVIWKMLQFRSQLTAIENPQWERRLADEHLYLHPIVLFGDSQVYNWPIATSFGSLPILDRGVKGMYAVEATRRFERDVLPLHPALVVILIGTNDIANEVPIEFIRRSIELMSSSARKQGVPVIICSVLPAGGGAARLRPRETIELLDASLRALADTQGAGYVDLYSALQDNRGQLAATFSDDGLHPNAVGYLHMTGVLLPHLLRYYANAEPGAQSTGTAKPAPGTMPDPY